MKLIRKQKKRKGQALVEYALIVAAVALTSIVAISVFGHKVADVIAVMAGVLPGAHSEDNKPIDTDSVFTIDDSGTSLVLDTTGMADEAGTNRWSNVFGTAGASQFVSE